MTVARVTLFLALLAVIAEGAVLIALVLAAGGRRSAAMARWRSALAEAVRPQALVLGLGVALIATSGSLWLSKGAHFIPCELCWYQRIAMYPLVPLLGLAVWRRDVGVVPYVLVLAVPGGIISTYHVLLERFPSLESGVCDPANPCSLIWVQRFGYLTIPAMALSAFALIVTLALVAREEPAHG